jgi:hypothetical protein
MCSSSELTHLAPDDPVNDQELRPTGIHLEAAALTRYLAERIRAS